MASQDDNPQNVKVWLITGCSSGLGRHLVSAALDRGDRVIATARRLASIQDLPQTPNLQRFELDVTWPEIQLQDKMNDILQAFGSIDVLVNNAGFVVSGVVEELRQHSFQAQFDTNVFGALKMTRAVLPAMRKQQSGTILFMGSIAGWYGVGAGSAYSASKFALEGAAECLAKEVQRFGVRVHIFVLGQFRTAILTEGKKQDLLESDRAYVEYDWVKQEMADRHAATNGLQPGDPTIAAQKMVDIVKRQNLHISQNHDIPLRIPLGSDAVQVMRAKSENTLELLENWKSFAAETDFPDTSGIPSYSR